MTSYTDFKVYKWANKIGCTRVRILAIIIFVLSTYPKIQLDEHFSLMNSINLKLCKSTEMSYICIDVYNHKQKFWDTFAFLGHFPIPTGPTPPPTPQTMLDECIQKFSEFQLCPKDFCPGLSNPGFGEKSLFSSFFLRFLGILETSRWSHAIIMTFETIFST